MWPAGYINNFYRVATTTAPVSPQTGKPIILPGGIEWKTIVKQANADTIQVATPIPQTIAQSVEQADLAEYYPTSGFLEPGDVVESKLAHDDPSDPEYANPEKRDDSVLVKTSQPYSPKAIGIISTNPAQIINVGGSDGQLPIALAGRVPVKVSTENGPIMIGDALTSSSTPGVAMRATRAVAIVGKALESFEGPPSQEATEGQSKIMAFVNISWYDPDVYLTSTGELKIEKSEALSTNIETNSNVSNFENSNLDIVSNLGFRISNLKGEIITRIGSFAELIVAKLQAGLIQVTELIAETITTKFFRAEQSDTKLARIEKLEMVDDESGEVYCVTISSGEFKKVKGGCQSPQPTLIPEAQTTSENPTSSISPLPTEFPVESPTPTPTSDIQIGGTATESAVVVEPSPTPQSSPSAIPSELPTPTPEPTP